MNKVEKILIVAATALEIQPTRDKLKHKSVKTIDFLITGVGMLATGIKLMQRLEQQDYDLVINAGIAGAFDRSIELGEVVQVVEERIGDLGVEEQDGSFTDMFEIDLIQADEKPFKNKKLQASNPIKQLSLRLVSGLTVNKVHGEKNSIQTIQNKYQPDIESMEGAAVFYACQLKNIPVLQIRSISNYVEPRNRSNWKISLAVENLNNSILNILDFFATFE